LPSALEVIAQYLSDSISAERAFEAQHRSLAEDGDDAEVQTWFETSAQRAASHIQLLSDRLSRLNAAEPRDQHFLSGLFAAIPKVAQMRHTAEERVAQNLMKGFAQSKSASAMYLALQSAARAARDEQTADLAAQLAVEEQNAAEQIWHFLPSRSKIAYNILTAGEVDPAVETRAPDDRLTEAGS
jgi:ferritin-like metal-binding protein YciE